MATCFARRAESSGRFRNFYRDVWTPAQKRAGVSFTLYDLRHTFASRLLAAGIPVVEVSAWMGHTIRAGGQEVANTTTRVYAHATGEHREQALSVLAELFDIGPSGSNGDRA